MIKAIIGLFLGLIVIISLGSAKTVPAMIPLYNCQIINAPGNYILQNNLATGGYCFILNANNIDLNLNGYTITKTGFSNQEAIISNANRVTIRNGVINNFGTGISLNGASFNIIENNVITNTDEEGIYVFSGTNNSIRNNRIIDTQNYGIDLRNTLHNRIENNVIKNSTNYDFHITVNSTLYCDNFLSNNRGSNGHQIILVNNASIISNSKLSELVLCDADNSKINRVLIDNSGFNNNGILLIRTENSILKDVTVKHSSKGIFMIYGVNITILNSAFNNNRREGIIMWEGGLNSIIKSFINGNDLALELSNARNNTLHSNYFTGNSDGIDIEDDDDLGNNLFYNNFFNNTWNIIDIDGEGINNWNTTLTSGINIVGGPFIGGNFWANYSGTGFSQTCIDANNDRICDQPYLLENYYINNTDYLALRQ